MDDFESKLKDNHFLFRLTIGATKVFDGGMLQSNKRFTDFYNIFLCQL